MDNGSGIRRNTRTREKGATDSPDGPHIPDSLRFRALHGLSWLAEQKAEGSRPHTIDTGSFHKIGSRIDSSDRGQEELSIGGSAVILLWRSKEMSGYLLFSAEK